MTDEMFRGPHVQEGGIVVPEEARKSLVGDESELLKKLEGHIVEDQEISHALDSIDFSLLEDIFTRHLHRSAPGESVKARIVPRNKIILTNNAGIRATGRDERALMLYASEGVILVDVETVRKRARYFDGPLPLLMLLSLSHEQGHSAASHYQRAARSGHVVGQVGLEQQHFEGHSKNPSFRYNLISEGVNEALARLVTKEYVEKTHMPGITSEHLERLTNPYHVQSLYSPFFLTAAHLVNVLTEHIVRNAPDMRREDVWNAFVHAQMQGLNLDDKRVQKILDRDFGEGFVGKLAKVTWDNLPDFLVRNKLTYRILEYQKRLHRIPDEWDAIDKRLGIDRHKER